MTIYCTDSNHFCLALIKICWEEDGECIVYSFDSFQCQMEDDVRYCFALLLMESQVCDKEAKCAEIQRGDVEAFMSRRMRFIRVQVSVRDF
jgi:hypothetical protein